MIRMKAIAVYIALTTAHAPAHAQPVSAPEGKPQQVRTAGESILRCAYEARAPRGLQPCGAGWADELLRIASDVTRQELECLLSGACGTDDRARGNG